MLHSRTWDTAVHGKHSTSVTVGGCSYVCELEPVFNCDPSVGHHIIVVGADVVVAPNAAVACSITRAYIARTQALDLEWRYLADICGTRVNRENGGGSKVRHR